MQAPKSPANRDVAPAQAQRVVASERARPATPPVVAPQDDIAQQNLSPEQRKQLAGEHLKALLEQKKRRMQQTPPWKKIEHHDHPAPRADSGGEARGDSGAPVGADAGVRPRGDRGGG